MTFPQLDPPTPSVQSLPAAWCADDGRTPAGVYPHFLPLRRPTEVDMRHLTAFNVSFAPQADFDALLASASPDAPRYLPPASWLRPDDDAAPRARPAMLSSGSAGPTRAEFCERVAELRVENDHAFSTFSRKGVPGRRPTALRHFRRFWESLDNMAYYWDVSLDRYLPVNAEDVRPSSSGWAERAEGETKSPSTTVGNAGGAKSKNNGTDSAATHTEQPRKKAKTSGDDQGGNVPAPPASRPAADAAAQSGPKDENTAPQEPGPSDWCDQRTYRGYRTGCGADMPDSYRIETVRAFVEGITWAFGVTCSVHRRPPFLALESLRFPIRMSAAAWRLPQQHAMCRSGWLEGPVLGVQCRPEVGFGLAGALEPESVLDAAREIGGLLFLAQERARAGKTEQKAGEGKWWVTKPRWGGGPGGEFGKSLPPDVAAGLNGAAARPMRPSGGGRRPNPAEAWRILRPSMPMWDPKVVYDAVGKRPGDDWDDVRPRLAFTLLISTALRARSRILPA